MPDFVTIDGAAVDQIEETIARLTDAAPDSAELRLCFDNHWAEDSQHPALLGAALMGTLANRPLVVDVVDQDAVDRLMRFGVAAALWRRPSGRTRFTDGAEALNRPSLGAVWTVGSRATTDALFSDDAASAQTVGPRHATFVNAHLSSGSDGRPDIVYLIARWLTRRLPAESASKLVDDVAVMLGELVANVHEHAAGSAKRVINSLVRVAIDPDAVRCSVSDTGVGICESAAPKIGNGSDPAELLRQLLAGELERWHHGRGIGLARVVQLAFLHNGRLTLATNISRAVVDNGEITVGAGEFKLDGTVVDLTMPLPSAARD